MQSFGKDTRFVEDDEDVEKTSNYKNNINTEWLDEQTKYINSLKKRNDNGCIKYFDKSMSIRKFAIVHQCYTIGDEYAAQITSTELSDQQSEVVLYGYLKELNVFEQVKAGESLENLKLLIDLVANEDIEIRDFFDETGEYLDYEKIKETITSSN